MLVVENNTRSCTWEYGDSVTPINYFGEVVISIDPSKSNMAVFIGTPTGEFVSAVEFSGNNRKRGPVMDTTQYCFEVRHFLAEYLQNVNVYMVGVEQAITKEGNKYHHSDIVLKEVRSNILNFFLEEYGIKVIEINNWSWKFAVLPEGYRSKYEKGSKKFFERNLPDSPFTHYFEADMTDCICIFWYMIEKFCSGYSVYCNKAETTRAKYSIMYVPEVFDLGDGVKSYFYNDMFTLEENLCYYLNRVLGRFSITVPIDNIELSDIYGKTMGFFEYSEDIKNVKVVVTRL